MKKKKIAGDLLAFLYPNWDNRGIFSSGQYYG